MGNDSLMPDVEVVIIVVSYNGSKYLPDCLASVYGSDDGNVRKRVIVVDNASSDGSEALVRSAFPQAIVLPAGSNLGFAGANNFAWQFVEKQNFSADFVCLLNQDTIVESGWLRELVDYASRQPALGAVQPKILLHPETSKINTVGNRSHFLGFGFTQAYGQPDGSLFATPRPLHFASGAAMLIRTDLIQRCGLFESEMFMYLEDADLGWKLRQLGHGIHFVPASRVYHKYSFNRDFRFYYYLERNRWWLLLVYYRLATLVVLAPALLLMEIGQWIFAACHGRLCDKLRAYLYFCDAGHLRNIWRLRRAAQSRRVISDREFTRTFSGTIESPELSGFLVRYFANPVFGAYWAIVRRLIAW